MPYVTLKNGNRIEAVDEFTGQSMAIEANREERKIEVDLGDGGAPVELDGADEVARQAAAEAKAQAAEAQASAAANAQAIAQANAEISRVENKEDQAISGVRTDLATTDGKADANAAAVSGLDTRLGTAESTITSHSSAIATNADNISLVEAKATHADEEAERISKLIPNDATIDNKLATKEFVNSTVATNTATFRGTYNSLAELEAVAEKDINDYGFVVETSGSATVYKRYKYDGSAWVWEYDLNNSSFTAAQWNAINSGADASKISQIEANRLAIAQLDAGKADASDVADLNGRVVQVETDLATKASAGDLAALETTVEQNTSSIATNTSAINNLATVARTGSYNDLRDKPTSQQVQADWDQDDSLAVDYIKNKPNLAAVATSGDYNDLSNTPSMSSYLENRTTSESSLAILGGSDVSEFSVALGDNICGNNSEHVTIVGNQAEAAKTASVNNANFATAIGDNSKATHNATSLGAGALALNVDSMALGSNARVAADNSIQIGSGINTEANTLCVGSSSYDNYKLLDLTDGLIPDERLSSNIARTSDIPSPVTVDQTYEASSTNAVSSVAISNAGFLQNNNTFGMSSLSILGDGGGNYTTLLGRDTTASGFSNVVAIGYNAKASQSQGANATAIGYGAEAGMDGVALGYNAKSLANNAIQIGQGTNSEDSSLYVGLSDTSNYKLLGSDGLIPVDRLTVMTGADGSSTGTIGAVPAPEATDNTKFLRGDGTWAEAGSASADTQVINFQQIIYDENNGVAQWKANTDTETNTTYPYKQTMRADCPFPVPLDNSDYAKFLVSVVYPAKTVLGKELAPFVTFEVAYDLSTQKNYIAITHYSKTNTVATNYGDNWGRVYATIGVTYDDKRWEI